MESTLGYLSLGMHQDAWDELEMLPPALCAREEVLEIRIEIFQRLGKWESARGLAESLTKRNPENPDCWLSWAFALRREKSIETAEEVLVEAINRHADIPLIAYNLACYACVLGRLDETTDLLRRAF